MSKTYSPSYREALVARLRGPEAISAHMLSEETGVAQSTLSRWLRETKDPLLVTKRRRPRSNKARKTWSIEEKVRLLSEASKLSEEDLGAFLRQEGVHPEELTAWRTALEDGQPNRRAERRIRALERELLRKDKALAEAAALLILKKKAQTLGLIPGDEDEDTDIASES